MPKPTFFHVKKRGRPKPPSPSSASRAGLSSQPAVHLFFHLKTRTYLHPLPRFNHPIAVQVRTEIAVSHYACHLVVVCQHPHQYPQRMFLLWSACVFGLPSLIESSFVADAYAVGVVAPGVSTYPLHRTHGVDNPVAVDIEMIAATMKTALPVHPVQRLRSEFHARLGGRAVNHNQVNLSHPFCPSIPLQAHKLCTSGF